MKNHRGFSIALAALALAIWGVIAFKVYTAVASTENETGLMSAPPKSLAHQSTFVYSRDIRDPFRFFAVGKVDTAKTKILKKQEWSPPPFKLRGVVMAGRKKLLMLETDAGAIQFAHEGDTLQGVKVLKIGSDSVGYVYQTRKSQWAIPRE